MDKKERAEFLERRRGGIGGSDIGAILNVDRFNSPLDVWLDKMGRSEDREPTEAMQRGIYLEPVVAQLYIDATGRKLRNGKFRRHLKHTLMVGHHDRIIVARVKDGVGEDGVGALELKTMNRWAFQKLLAVGPPDSHVLQVQHYMAITGAKWGALAYLCPDPWQFEYFHLEFDEALYEKIAARCMGWWKDHVTTGIPPTPEQQQFEDAPPPKEDEEVVVMEGERLPAWSAATANYIAAHELRVNGQALEKLAKMEIEELMSEGPGVYEGSGIRVYHRLSNGRRTLDRKSLEAMGPVDPITMATLLAEAGIGTDDIEVLLEAARLDLGRFDKIGKSFTTTKIYERTTE